MRGMSLFVVCVMVLALTGPVLAGQAAETGTQGVSVGDFEPVPDGICRATATCWDGSVVLCSGISSSSTCYSVDSSCPSQRGYVKCDGVYTWCPACPSCPLEGGFCFDDWECHGYQGCEDCFCMTELEKPLGACVCP